MKNFFDPRITILGNSSIGIFGSATNGYAIFPLSSENNFSNMVSEILKVPLITTTVSNSNLIGLFVSGNTKNLLLPSIITEDEYKSILEQCSNGLNVHIIDSKITALGNTIVSSDKIAIVHPNFSSTEKKILEDCLDVEVISKKLMNNPLVGSLIVRNSNGILVHPLMPEEDIEWLIDTFQVKADVVTVNRGTPFPRPGIITNKNGYFVGSDTTGPELVRISEILSV